MGVHAVSAPFIDPGKVVESCQNLSRSFYAFAAEYETEGNHSEAERLRREADAHMAFAEHFRTEQSEQHEAA